MVYPIDNPFDGRGARTPFANTHGDVQGGEVAAGRLTIPEEPRRASITINQTWASLIPSLLACVDKGATGDARRTGMAELHRMARAADAAGKMLDTLRSVVDWLEASSIPRAYSADTVEAIRATIREVEAA
jgi:hypothetical protein